MFYRVDYRVALVLAGALATIVLSRRAARLDPRRLARGYLVTTAILGAIPVALYVGRFAAGPDVVPARLPAALGDLGILLVGVPYGLAIVELVRGGSAPALRAPELRFALCLSTGMSFALFGVGKAFGLAAMVTFFAQSGYSKSFLWFIIAIEVFGGMALLLPWRWVIAATVAGLAIDMFGAIYTHAHNGDPLDDSSDAVVMLLRLAPIAVLCVRARWAALGAAVCAALAVACGTQLRRDAVVQPVDALTGSRSG